MFANKRLKIILVLIILLISTSYVAADGHILVFHRFGDSRHPATNISQNELVKTFDYLEKNNYQVVKLEKLVSYIEEDKTIPEKTVALTIDDGYKSFYENGLDIFQKYNYPFTIFINTKPINQGYSDFLTWRQIAEIAKYGTIANHSYSHPHLTTLSEEEIAEDVIKSSNDIKANLAQKAEFFSYPYGEYNQKVIETIKSLDFRAIFNQNLGAVAKESDIYDLNRIAVSKAAELQTKLAYEYLAAKWPTRDEMVTNNRLRRLRVKTSPEIEEAQLYLSGHGWRRVELEGGVLDLKVDLRLKYSRNRIFLKTYDNELSGKLIMKR